MRIQHNIAALNSYRQLGTNNNAVSKNLEKLSSGYRINRAGDDAAGLAISEKMRAQITGLETAQKNAQDGISLVQTAEGALTEVHSMLNRMTELATQSANGTYSSEVDRENLQKEVATLKDEIDRISKSTNFNGIKLLDGSLGDASGISNSGTSDFTSIAIENFGKPGTLVETGNIVTGEFTKGSAAQTGSESFYVSDQIVLTQSFGAATAATGGNTVSFDIKLGDATLNIKLDSGVATTGTAEHSVSMEKIIDKISSYVGLTGASTTASIDGVRVEFSLTTGAKIGSFEELNDNFTLSYKTNAAVGATSGHLDIEAKKQSSDSAYDIGGISNFVGSVQSDIDKALNDIRHDLGTNSANVSKIGFGTSLGNKVVGSEGAESSYKVSSMEFKIDLTKLADLHGKSIVIDGMTYIFSDNKNINDPLSQGIKDYAASNTNAKIINYDSSVTDTDRQDHLLNTLANEIRHDSFVSGGMAANNSGITYEKFDVSVSSNGTIRIEESKEFAEDMLDFGNQTTSSIKDIDDKITKMQIGTNTDKVAPTATSDIDIDNDLKSGVWVTIDGKTYQFASSPDRVEPGKVFVQFTEGDAEANANALLAAMQAENPATVVGSVTTPGKFDDAEVVSKGNGKFAIQFGQNAPVSIQDSGSKGLSLQVGDTSESYQKVTVKVGKMDTKSLGIDDVDISEVEGAEEAIGKLRNAINQVSATRGDLGAVQNRLEHTINNLGVTTENITAAESRIRDTDMAQEMMAYTKNNILVQAAQAMLAQANTVPQGVLQLLG